MKYGRLLLAAALVLVILIGGSDASRYVTEVRIALTILGAGTVLIYMLRLPAQHDLVDLLALAALLLYLAACVFSSIPRMSFDAATTAMAFVAVFYLARGLVADKGGRRLTTTALGLTGFLFSGFFLILWGSIWLRWSLLAGTPPPFDLVLPATPYRHPYLVGMLAALLLPATIQLTRRPVIWPLGMLGTVASIAVAIMSGSRTVWLGGTAALLLCAVLAGRRYLPHLTWRWVVAGLVSVPVMLVVGGPLLDRLAAGSTIASRLGIWGASLRHWLESPVTGFGPGTFAPQLALSGYYQNHEGLVPHGHNVAVQLVLEAGLLGVAIAVTLGAMAFIAVRRRDSYSIAPIAGVTFFAGASLTDNPSIIPYLVLPAIVWAAVAVPRRASKPVAVTRWARMASIGLAAVAAAACGAVLAAAWFYDDASAAAARGDTGSVVERVATATTLDPANALYWRDLAAWNLAGGRLAEADRAAANAIRLNPGDDTAWRVAAAVSLQANDNPAAYSRAAQATHLRPTDPLNQLLLAYVAQRAGQEAAEGAALARALRAAPWVAATDEWQHFFADATAASLQAALDHPITAEDPDPRAEAWLPPMAGSAPKGNADRVLAAAAAIIDCDLAGAGSQLRDLPKSETLTVEGLLTRIMLARASGMSESELLRLAELRYRPLASIAEHPIGGVSPLTGPAEDPLFYGRLSLPAPPVGPSLPISEGGLSAWLRDPRAAARVGAPDSRLATCQPAA